MCVKFARRSTFDIISTRDIQSSKSLRPIFKIIRKVPRQNVKQAIWTSFRHQFDIQKNVVQFDLRHQFNITKWRADHFEISSKLFFSKLFQYHFNICLTFKCCRIVRLLTYFDIKFVKQPISTLFQHMLDIENLLQITTFDNNST